MSTTIKLEVAVSSGELCLEELVLAKPTVGHILALDGKGENTVAGELAFAAALSGLPEKLLKKIEPEDWARIRFELKKIYARFSGIDLVAAIAAEAISAYKREMGIQDPTRAAVAQD